MDWILPVRDNNTMEETDKTPTGIEHVFINGHPAVAHGRLDTEILPGRVL